jgi:hypothetical protein
MDYTWFLADPRDDKEYEFQTIQELGMWMYKNLDAGDTVTVWHTHEL